MIEGSYLTNGCVDPRRITHLCVKFNELTKQVSSMSKTALLKGGIWMVLESHDDFVKYFPCDLMGDIKYTFDIGIEDCK